MAYLSRTDTVRGTRWFLRFKINGEGPIRTRRLGRVPEEEARRILADFESSIGGKPEAAVRLDAKTVLDKFLRSLEAQRATEETVGYYTKILTPFFEALGGKPLDRWTPADIEGVIVAHPGWGSKRTVAMGLGACRRLIGWCEANRIRVRDFTKGLKAQGDDARESTPYAAAEAKALLSMAREEKHLLELPIALALLAGLSLRDIRTVTWEEVDLGARLIRRKRSKTRQGRPIPVSAALLDVLTRHRATHGPVCRDLPVSESSLLKSLKRLERRAGLAPNGWHGLRHSFGTMLADSGATVAEIGAALQHRPGSVVTLRYVHASAKGTKDAVDAAGRSVSGK